MATLKLLNQNPGYGGMSPYGNTTTNKFTLETTATGAAKNASSTAALAIADEVVLGVMDAGFRLDDMEAVISTGMTVAVTGSLGFKYVDGVDSTVVPQNAAYFGAGLALATAARLRNATANAIVTLPKPANLVLTISGAANAKASYIDFVISGELTGPK